MDISWYYLKAEIIKCIREPIKIANSEVYWRDGFVLAAPEILNEGCKFYGDFPSKSILVRPLRDRITDKYGQ